MCHGDHTHLAYLIELPKRLGPTERDLIIKPEASYIVAVRNPESPRPPNAGRSFGREARFPPELQERFAGRRFIPVDPVELLDYERAELILIGAAENAEKELGTEFKPDDESEHTADVLRDLKLPRDRARAPLRGAVEIGQGNRDASELLRERRLPRGRPAHCG